MCIETLGNEGYIQMCVTLMTDSILFPSLVYFTISQASLALINKKLGGRKSAFLHNWPLKKTLIFSFSFLKLWLFNLKNISSQLNMPCIFRMFYALRSLASFSNCIFNASHFGFLPNSSREIVVGGNFVNDRLYQHHITFIALMLWYCNRGKYRSRIIRKKIYTLIHKAKTIIDWGCLKLVALKINHFKAISQEIDAFWPKY